MRSPITLSVLVVVASTVTVTCTHPHREIDPGRYVDLIAIDGDRALAVRERVVEMYDTRQGVRWRTIVSGYAGTPQVAGLSANADAVTVRVVRDGRAAVMVLRADDGAMTATLPLTPEGWPPSATGYSLAHVMTVPGRGRVYELLGDEHRGAVVAIEHGAVAWRREVSGRIDLAAVAGDDLALVVDGKVQLLGAAGDARPIGGEITIGDTRGRPYALTSDLAALLVPSAAAPPPRLELVFDPASRTLTGAAGTFRWPAAALAPEPHHHADGVVWLIFPDHLARLDARTLQLR